ncbi:MAG: hypothetical protein KAI83_12965 [Thiomargarita sp.]|nr:hypothetical protein [Thiomargarita sp.]
MEKSLKIEQIEVYSLKEMDSYLTRETCDFFSQAAAVCLDNQNHSPGVIFKVEGDLLAQFPLFWKPVTGQMKNSCYDIRGSSFLKKNLNLECNIPQKRVPIVWPF